MNLSGLSLCIALSIFSGAVAGGLLTFFFLKRDGRTHAPPIQDRRLAGEIDFPSGQKEKTQPNPRGDHGHLLSTFERYLSKPLTEEILRQGNNIKLGGEEKVVTILFSDIRRFTSLAEALPPQEVVELLNDYFTRMIQVVARHEGMVDKLMGDSLMALFGAPLSFGDEPMRAVRCAMDMQRAVAEFNWVRASSGLPSLEMGIGINTGPVVAGNLGSATRMEYTVVGDNVNVAARLQGIARPGEVLISEATCQAVSERVRVTALTPITLKGKSRPIGIYRVENIIG